MLADRRGKFEGCGLEARFPEFPTQLRLPARITKLSRPMKPSPPLKPYRPKKVVALTDSPELDGWKGFFNKHLNTMSTIVLLILAGVMLVRWRMNSAANAKYLIGTDLSNAQSQVLRLRTGFAQIQSPADRIKQIQQTETQASAGLSNVVNSTDADDQMRAEAFVLRGDMYWYLANLPPLPGSNSEPTLRLSESTDTLLQKSADSYQQVIKDPAFAKQHEQINTAHLGLAAIAENRADWTAAERELKAVIDDPDAVSVLADQAKLQMIGLDTLKKPLYVVPPSGLEAPATMPTTMPFGPFLMPELHSSTTKPAGH
jgi:hypothetical protein